VSCPETSRTIPLPLIADKLPFGRTPPGHTTSAEFTTYSESAQSAEEGPPMVVGTVPLGPEVSRNNCSESATLRPIPDRLEGAPDLEDELMVMVRARRRLFGAVDDGGDGENEGIGRERREEEEEDDDVDMGDVERGRDVCANLPRDSGEGNPGDETVDRGMSRGTVIARTTTGERELLFLLPRIP